MAYSTSANLQTMLTPLEIELEDADEPTTTTVDEILIPASDGEIDQALTDYYTTPITNVTDLKLLKWISMLLTAGKVAQYLLAGRSDPDTNSVLLSHQDEGRDFLRRFKEGTLSLETSRKDFVDKGIQAVYTASGATGNTPQVSHDQDF